MKKFPIGSSYPADSSGHSGDDEYDYEESAEEDVLTECGAALTSHEEDNGEDVNEEKDGNLLFLLIFTMFDLMF